MIYRGQHFNIRDLNYSTDFLTDTNLSGIIDDCVVEVDGVVQALGTIRSFSELTMQLEHGSVRNRVLAFRTIMKYGLERSEKHGIKSVYVRVTDPDFERILKRHYEFSDVNGKFLVREV